MWACLALSKHQFASREHAGYFYLCIVLTPLENKLKPSKITSELDILALFQVPGYNVITVEIS